MVSYNYVRISINFQLLLQKLVDRKIILATNYFYVTFNIALDNLKMCKIR